MTAYKYEVYHISALGGCRGEIERFRIRSSEPGGEGRKEILNGKRTTYSINNPLLLFHLHTVNGP